MSIWIVSQNIDASTDHVIEYIQYFKGNVKRLNFEDGVFNMTLLIEKEVNIYLENNTGEQNLSEFKSFWYRRGVFPIRYPFSKQSLTHSYFQEFLTEEWNHVNTFLFKSNSFLGSFVDENLNNKLLNIVYAKKCEFKVPNTIVTMSRKQATDFCNKYKKVITKPINNHHIDFKEDTICIHSTGTQLVDFEENDSLCHTFAPMLLQEYIQKEIEIRVFFYEKEYFAMAIFSQNDSKTQIDYRNYNKENPNRNIPFKLPIKIKNKLKKLSKKLGINTGSYDLILDKMGDYVFLEVNPVGQFNWLSSNCNYYIEEKIANYLMKKHD